MRAMFYPDGNFILEGRPKDIVEYIIRMKEEQDKGVIINFMRIAKQIKENEENKNKNGERKDE